MSQTTEEKKEETTTTTQEVADPKNAPSHEQPETSTSTATHTEAPPAEHATEQPEQHEEASNHEEAEEHEPTEDDDDQEDIVELAEDDPEQPYTLEDYLDEAPTFTSIRQHKRALKECIAINGAHFRVYRNIPNVGFQRVGMSAIEIRAHLDGIKLQYEPAKEFNSNVRDERYNLVEELDDLAPPHMPAEAFVSSLQPIQAGHPANLDQFQVIEHNDSTRVRTKKNYIRLTRFDELCARHGFVSPIHRANVERAMEAAGWTKGAMQNVKCWRRE